MIILLFVLGVLAYLGIMVADFCFGAYRRGQVQRGDYSGAFYHYNQARGWWKTLSYTSLLWPVHLVIGVVWVPVWGGCVGLGKLFIYSENKGRVNLQKRKDATPSIVETQKAETVPWYYTHTCISSPCSDRSPTGVG